jgi:hypothetical protein
LLLVDLRRRPRTGLGSLVATLTGKGKKASVLDKSKEDWDKFKETDGKEFVHDMEQAKKDGCAFLEACLSCLIVVRSPTLLSFIPSGIWVEWSSWRGPT